MDLAIVMIEICPKDLRKKLAQMGSNQIKLNGLYVFLCLWCQPDPQRVCPPSMKLWSTWGSGKEWFWIYVLLLVGILYSWTYLLVTVIVTYWATLQEMGWNNLQRLIGVDHLAHLPDGEGVVDVHPVQLLLVLQEQKRRLFPLIVPANPDNRGQKGVKWWNVCTALELQLTLANTRGKSGRFGFLPAAGKRNHCRRDWNPKQALNFSHMEVWTENGQGLFLLTFFDIFLENQKGSK